MPTFTGRNDGRVHGRYDRMMSGASVKLAMALVGTDYEFQRQLGVGGGGVVVLARDVRLDRLVAVKTITTAGAADTARARLRREGRALATLRHQSILGVYRLVEDGSTIAIVTEYLAGGDFDTALRERTLPGSAVVDVLCQVASALDAAHELGLVHRDVKPANVLLDGAGRTAVADFGLARVRGEFRTEDGLVTGTPQYMSPEQIEHPDVERPSMDVYSFAVMAYRALTGRAPFVTENLAELITAHRQHTPDHPAEINPDLPVAVCEVLMSALDKNPDRRARLTDIASTLHAVDAAVWNAVLPMPQSQAPPYPCDHTPADMPVADMPVTEAIPPEPTATQAESGTTGPSILVAPATVAMPATAEVKQFVEPTLFLVEPSPAPRRWRWGLTALAAGLVAGALIGVAVLFLLAP